jgi:hypothetical protein
MARVSYDTHASIGCQRAGAPFQNADRPTRRHARRWGDLASPSGDGRGPWTYGPGSFPPACTLLSRTYLEPHSASSSRSKRLGRPPIPVTFPPTFSIRWNRNASPPRLGATAGHTPRRSAATAAANAAARLRPVSRDGDSTLAFIYRRFSLGSSCSTIRNAKSRVSVVFRSEHLALLRWSSGGQCSANHRTEDLRDATPGQAADSLANAADLRKSGLGRGGTQWQAAHAGLIPLSRVQARRATPRPPAGQGRRRTRDRAPP